MPMLAFVSTKVSRKSALIGMTPLGAQLTQSQPQVAQIANEFLPGIVRNINVIAVKWHCLRKQTAR